MAENPTKAPDAPAPRENLNPQQMPGKGQNLSPIERSQAESTARLAETKAKHAEEQRKDEAAVLLAQRDVIASEQDKRREEAVKLADEQRKAFQESHDRLRPLAVDAATLAIEASLNAAMAAALEQDETVPGGVYVVDGKLHDADGRALE